MIGAFLRFGGNRTAKEASSGGGGGGPAVTYTRLWTNSSPSSSMAQTTANLSSAASGYDYLRIVWSRINTAGVTADNWGTSTESMSIMYDMRNASLLTDTTNRLQIAASERPGAGYYSRRGWFTSSACTAITFGQCQRWQQSQTNNALLIPVLIDGVTFSA